MAYSAEVPSGYTPGITDEEVFKTHAQSVVPPPHQYESIIFADSLERPYLYGLWLIYYNVMLIMASKYAGPGKAAYVNMYSNGVKRATADASGTTASATTSAGTSHTGKIPKPPALTPCDIFGPHVDVYIKSVQLYLYNYTLTTDMEVAMVYVNNLTEASKAHLYNIHPLSEIAFYSSSKNVIDFLELFTNKSEKVTHSLSKLRSLTMKGCKLKAYYQQFTKLLADIGWDHSSTEAIRFFVEGLNPDALPTNLKLAVSDYTTYPGITVMQLFTYADRKLSLAHGENYSNVSTSNTKTTTNGDSSGSKKSVKSNGGGVQNNKNKKSPSNTNKQQSSKKQKTARVEYDECERCGRKHLGLCNAWRHKDGTHLGTPPAPTKADSKKSKGGNQSSKKQSNTENNKAETTVNNLSVLQIPSESNDSMESEYGTPKESLSPMSATTQGLAAMTVTPPAAQSTGAGSSGYTKVTMPQSFVQAVQKDPPGQTVSPQRVSPRTHQKKNVKFAKMRTVAYY